MEHLCWFLLPSEALSYLAGALKGPSPHKCIINIRSEIKQLSTRDIKEQIRIPSRLRKIKQTKEKKKSQQKKNRKPTPVLPHGGKAQSRPQCLQPLPSKNPKQSFATTTKHFEFVSPPKRLFKQTVAALEEFKMIENGDKVLVCLSGGKVSLKQTPKHFNECIFFLTHLCFAFRLAHGSLLHT